MPKKGWFTNRHAMIFRRDELERVHRAIYRL